MKCYYHPGVDAVAVCKSCCRALCHDCIAEVGLGCSCRDRCESDVAALNDLFERSRRFYQKASAASFQLAIAIFTFAVVFIALGLSEAARGDEPEFVAFLFSVGVLLIGCSIANFVTARRWRQK